MTRTFVGPVTRPSLLLRLRDPRDHKSWRAFVDTYGPIIQRYCRRRGLQEADAAEISQEVLLQVSRSIGKFEYEPERGRFRAWLGTVTRNQVFRFWKLSTKNHEQVVDLESQCKATAEQEWNEEFDRHILTLALERIRPSFTASTWQAFEKVWLAGESAPKVSDDLNIPIDHVYVAKSRVLKQLKLAVSELVDQQSALDFAAK